MLISILINNLGRSSIVRRINVNTLHLLSISFLKQIERLKIFAVNQQAVLMTPSPSNSPVSACACAGRARHWRTAEKREGRRNSSQVCQVAAQRHPLVAISYLKPISRNTNLRPAGRGHAGGKVLPGFTLSVRG